MPLSRQLKWIYQADARVPMSLATIGKGNMKTVDEATLLADAQARLDAEATVTPLHWNEEIPGVWCRLYRLNKVGSNIGSHIRAAAGVYRLVGLTDDLDATAPATLDRVCGRDQTGTLYIGHARRLPNRLVPFVRSLKPPRGQRHRLNSEHPAGKRLLESILSNQFPTNRLAITWAYDPLCGIMESILFGRYLSSFGETPPLNRQAGD
jgi:hypothetical protein